MEYYFNKINAFLFDLLPIVGFMALAVVGLVYGLKWYRENYCE